MHKLIIVSAPSGCGKTSLIKALLKNRSDIIVSISHTTRAKRTGEQNHKDYHFITIAEFETMQQNGEFIEFAKVFDNYYGTSQKSLQDSLLTSNVIVEIDWQGARQLKIIFPESISIFITPPSIAELESRLQLRGDDSAIIKCRMEGATAEISHSSEYDHQVVNDDFDNALRELTELI